MHITKHLAAALAFALFAAGAAAEQGGVGPSDPRNAVVLIFNHGTARPQQRHVCNENRDIPGILREVAAANGWTVRYLCSSATDEGVRGSYTYKRADEILA